MGKQPRALITGIDGFTGRYVQTELITAGWEVFGTGIQDFPKDDHYLRADLNDLADLNAAVREVGPDVVVHLAGIAYVGHGDASAFYQIHLLGTRNLLMALDKAGKKPRCVLLASSANVYGNTTEGILTEATPLNPANDYAVSKLAMEYMARLWLDKLPIIIVRPFNYTGAGQSGSFLLPKIVAHFYHRAEVIELGNLDVWRDFSDVRAVAQAYRRLLENCPAGETVNICSGHTHSLREVIAMAELITGHKIRLEVNSEFVRSNEVKMLCGDPSKLRRLIGEWETPHLEQTLRWMLREAGTGLH
jgi:nucleoside-diphosphate-sugar epimerase